jgi:UDP-3-O-[3-hydroxymyristoyl] glucosamine N-acyltransferase
MEHKIFTLAQLAELTKCTLVGNPAHEITNVCDLEGATESDASFLANPRYAQAMVRSNAGVIFVNGNSSHSENRNLLISDNPSAAFQKVIDVFYGTNRRLSGFLGIHPTAVIHPSSTFGPGCTICPHAVIDENVIIGENTFVGSGSYIGPNSIIGNDCLIHPNVTIREDSIIGKGVIIQPGAIIGSCGFGYITDNKGHHQKLNQVGNVIIEDNVEIGANTTIDRSRFKSTQIHRGTKIDNLVQIAHGVKVGEDNFIVAQAGIAGSSETGRHVILAGQSALAGHIKIADGVVLAGRAGATKSIREKGNYGGVPAIPIKEFNKNSVYLRNIENYINEIKELKSRLEKLENEK